MKWFKYLLIGGFLSASPITIATGSLTGTYYQFGKNIMQQCGDKVPIKVLNTKGTVDNFNKLLNRSAQLAIVQFDGLLLLYKKYPEDAAKMRLVLPLYGEEIHLITLKDSSINNIDDLEGKKVVMGHKESGTQITAKFILKKAGIFSKVKPVYEGLKKGLNDLYKRKVDAVFAVGGVPLKILNIKDPNNKKFKVLKNKFALSEAVYNFKRLGKYYPSAVISPEKYKWLEKEVKTRKVQSVLVIYKRNKKISSELKKLITCIYDNLDNFKTIIQFHPKWKEVNPSELNSIEWPVLKFVKSKIKSSKNTNSSSDDNPF